MRKVNIPVDKVSRFFEGAKIFRDPQDHEILVYLHPNKIGSRLNESLTPNVIKENT